MSPLHPLFPELLLLSTTSYGMEYPFGHLASAVLDVSPPILLATPGTLAVGAEWEKRKP